jgi:hypothetical protein
MGIKALESLYLLLFLSCRHTLHIYLRYQVINISKFLIFFKYTHKLILVENFTGDDSSPKLIELDCSLESLILELAPLVDDLELALF